ncbi:hypothetical protein AB6F55_20160 [Providencia hangzhouensis]
MTPGISPGLEFGSTSHSTTTVWLGVHFSGTITQQTPTAPRPRAPLTPSGAIGVPINISPFDMVEPPNISGQHIRACIRRAGG